MKFSVKEVEFFERPVKLRMPFRFGVVTLTEAPQPSWISNCSCGKKLRRTAELLAGGSTEPGAQQRGELVPARLRCAGRR
jgi:hypothetical protein